MNKQEWRIKLKNLRDAMEASQREKEVEAILTHLLPWTKDGNLKTWMVYLPLGSEVDTEPLIELLNSKGRTIYAPRMIDGNQLTSVVLDSEKGTSLQRWGIREPIGDPMPENFRPDVIIVPALGYDQSKHRLGYGKGYYDRYLSIRPKICLGLAFLCQVIDQLPRETHDQPLDAIVTSDGVIR